MPGSIPTNLCNRPVHDLMLYAVIRIPGGWQYTPVVFASAFLRGIRLFSTWAWYFSDE